jgi:VPDSG-CTERM motif
MDLEFLTGHTPGSLVGFTGGPIESGAVVQIATNNPAYSVNGGSITAPAGVPDGGTTVSLLGCALLGLAALRRKLSC